MVLILGITIATKTKQYTGVNAINELDLEVALDRLKSYDETLTELNLNNHKDLDEEKLFLVARNLNDNKHLKSLYMANTQMGDRVCKVSTIEDFLFIQGFLYSVVMIRIKNLFHHFSKGKQNMLGYMESVSCSCVSY